MLSRFSLRGFLPIFGFGVFALVIFSGTRVAGADVVNMDFTGTENNNSGGFYTYPYDISIDDVPAQLMCDDFVHHVNTGDIWTATTLDISDLNSTNVAGLQFPSAGVTGYLEASYLFAEEVTAFNSSNSDSEGLYNWAVWDLLSGSDVSGANLDSGDEAQVQSYLSAAETAGSSLSPSNFNGTVVYTPTDMTQEGPQEFFGYEAENAPVPEPSGLAALGLGILALLGRRQSASRIFTAASL